ncbi:MAG: hypothetical protein E4H40_08920 [Candidatus Brocadiia bacterium]|nr:MAG: hypothetical protein E4H40_08920 [Candidatus Brocadiia bacterium]
MMKITTKIMVNLTAVLVLGVAGCQSGSKSAVEGKKPDMSAIAVSAFAQRAMDATGGSAAWANTEKADLRAVVTIYKGDSYYLTEQQYEVKPWMNWIMVTSPEPKGTIAWQLIDMDCSVIAGQENSDRLDMGMSKRDFAEAVRDITTSAVRLLDMQYNFAEGADAVKAEGQWYVPITRQAVIAPVSSEAGKKAAVVVPGRWSKVVFYQRQDSSAVDMIWYADAAKNQYLMVRGYDYKKLDTGVLVPSRIELYSTNAMGISEKQLVKIDAK